MEKEVLTLHLAEPWYSMIVSAEKMEEYREIKPHWIKRLTTNCEVPYDVAAETHYGEVLYRPYTHVLFVKGYPKGNKPSVEKKIVDITIGKPKKGLCPKEFLTKNILSLNSSKYERLCNFNSAGIKHFSKGYHDRHDLFCNLCFHLYTCF